MNHAARFLRPAAALCMLAFAACATVNTVEPANPSATPKRVNDKRIITNSDLNDIAYVVDVYEGTVSGNLKIVQVKLRNMSSAVKNVNCEFEWFDQAGMLIQSPSRTWQPVVIEGGQTVSVQFVAPSPAAVDWKLDILPSVRRLSTPLP